MNSLEELTRAQLARLARETMLAVQFNSRTGYAGLRISHGDESYRDTAIDNWMAASPVYTRRMQRALGFAGESDVAAIFRGLQLDSGFAHQYFDVHYSVSSPTEGRFWLTSCGALLETEPRGDDAVKVMCHDIEDPTFDATACATNPRARMRPVHRPPRAPADRTPHCEWRVFIDEEADPLPEPALSERMQSTQLAKLALADIQPDSGGGLNDYRGELFEQLHFERFSHAALVRICQELAVQLHLLVNSLQLVVAGRYGDKAASAVTAFQFEGSARVVAERLHRSLAPELSGLEAIRFLLPLHPTFQPAPYFNLHLAVEEERLLLTLGDCPALQEAESHGWYPLMHAGVVDGLVSLLRGIDERATVERVDAPTTTLAITLAEATTGSNEEEPLSVQIARGAVLYRTQLDDHIQLLQL